MIRSCIPALVSTSWVSGQLQNGVKEFRILDASWHMKNTGRSAREEYLKSRIPTAGFFDIDAIADQTVDLPHMLPDTELFEKEIGKLGVSNDSHVVVYDNNESVGIFSAARVWWTLRVFDHVQVSVLDGGFPKWQREGLPMETGQPQPIKERTFKGVFHPWLVQSFDEMQKNVNNNTKQVVDARSPGRFNGIEPEPRSDIPSGHMPNSINVHYQDCLDSNKKIMKPPNELQRVFQSSGVDLSKPFIATCGSGITAALLALSAYTCGQKEVSIYDGSWTEWGQRPRARASRNHEQCIKQND